ncbi:MAG: Uncharacterised protein [Synechococcus sp. CC9902]|nr:MAG: Uncharacterised protein [Synechococcus sp. CC9902]
MNFKQGAHDLAEAVWIEFEKTLSHLRIVDEGLIGLFVNEVIDGATGGTPAEGEVETFGHLSHTFVTGIKHALVPLWIQQFGPRIQADGFAQRTNLGIGRGGIGDVAGRSFAVIAKTGDQLGGI